MSKPKQKAPDSENSKVSESNGKTLKEREDEAIERMVGQFVVKQEEKPVDKYFRALVKLEGSDLHMKVGKAPIVRVNGTLKELNRGPIEVEEMARRHYGPLEPTVGLKDRERPAEPPQLAERRITYEDARVAQPYVIRTYMAPERDAGDQKAAAALTMLSAILGGDTATSVMGIALQQDTKKAVYTGTFYSGMSYDDTTFGVIMVPTPELNLQQAEDEMDAVIAQFMKDGVDADHLARVKRQILASEIYEQDDVGGLARRYGAALTSGLTVADVQDWPKLLAEVTEQDILDAAEMIFDRDKAVTGWFRRPTAPEAVTEEVSQ